MRLHQFILPLFLVTALASCKKEDNSNNENNNSNNNTPKSSDHSIEYTFLPGKTGFDYNSPIIKGNYLYIGTSTKLFSDVENDNAFYKFDLQLTQIWKYTLDTNEVRGSAALDSDDNIYFTVQEGRKYGDGSKSKLYVYSLDNSGNFRWKKLIATGTEIKDVGAYELSVGNHVYVHGADLYALNKTDGSEAWKTSMIGGVSRPFFDNAGNIYMYFILVNLDRTHLMGLCVGLTLLMMYLQRVEMPFRMGHLPQPTNQKLYSFMTPGYTTLTLPMAL